MPVELGVKFRPHTDGTVTAVRFYYSVWRVRLGPAGTFPADSYLATDYGVDVTFAPDS